MKKGFTLIELLAVIVIVAIITLIATPIISNIVNNSKVGTLKSSAYGILEASNLYYAQNGSNGIRFDINDNIVTSNDTTKLLNYKGNIKRGTIIIDKKGNTTICITDGTNSAYKNYNDNDITTVTKETCNIPENKSIVYLESSGATRSELNNQELTDLVSTLQDEIGNLKTKNQALENTVNELENNKASKSELEIIGTVANSATLDKVYPVGSVYISTVDDTAKKVENKLGGTWETYASGKTLVGVDTTQTEFNEVNKTGGEKTHTLTAAEIPEHWHYLKYVNGSTVYTFGYVNWNLGSGGSNIGFTWTQAGSGTDLIRATGGSSKGQSHNNLQPYITVYMYKRVS